MNFLPVVLNQLFWVLVQNSDDEVATAVTRYLDNSCGMDRVHSGALMQVLVQLELLIRTSVGENAASPQLWALQTARGSVGIMWLEIIDHGGHV